MTYGTDWHIPDTGLRRYATLAASASERNSIEAHLLGCNECRLNLATATAADSAAGSDVRLAALLERIDQPRRPLRGARGIVAVSLASPALVAASLLLATTLLVTVGVVALVEPPASVAVLVGIAPLAPVLAAAISYWPASDPAGSLAVATPLAAGRLPFMRAVFATSVTALAGLVSSAFTPLAWSDSLTWLAPGFAFAAVVVAAATWIDPMRVAAGLVVGWSLVFALWMRGERTVSRLGEIDDLATHRAGVQALCIAVIVIAGLISLARRDARPSWRTT